MLRLAAAMLLASTTLAQAITVDDDPTCPAVCAVAIEGADDGAMGPGTGHALENPAFTGTLEVRGVFFFDYAGTGLPSSRLTREATVFLLPPSPEAGPESLLSAAQAPMVAPVPVPAAGLLLLGAVGALGAAARRR